jgi:Sec-independent protein secretion pathway component TatC
MDSRSRIEVRVRPLASFRAPFLSFFAILSVLAAPSPVAALAPNGSYVPLVSFLLNGIRDGILPVGWHAFYLSSSEPPEVDAMASVVLALLLSSPMIAYQAMKSIVSVRGTRRMLYSLTALASMLLASGALFGYLFLAKFLLLASTPVFDAAGPLPLLDAADFYMFALGAIAAGAVAFALPVCIYALVRFRG